MSNRHRATPEQWSTQKTWANINTDNSCILELLGRVEALEAATNDRQQGEATKRADDPAPYTLPAILVNGTKPLADEYSATCQAIDNATGALLKTGVFRDFYPEDDASYQQALDERAKMFHKLAEVQAYSKAWVEWASDLP